MRKSKTKTITEYYDEEGRLTQRETVEEEAEDDEATWYQHQWFPTWGTGAPYPPNYTQVTCNTTSAHEE